MRRKLLVWALVLGLALTLMPVSASAAVAVLTVKTPATIPRAGEAFTVTVDLSGNPGVRGLQFALGYDMDALTCTGAEVSEAFRGDISGVNPEAADGARVMIASTSIMTGDGTVATFWFTAKSDLSAYSFSILDLKLLDGDREDVDVTIATSSNAAAEVKPAAEATPPPRTETYIAEEMKPAEEQAPPAVKTFPDAVGHWGEEWITKAAARGLFSGDDKGNFRPDDNISRGDYVLVLWRMAGKPEPKQKTSFADVSPDAYYADAVAWAYENGYIEGKGSGFAPQDNLTRQEAMKILFGYAGSPSGLEMMLAADYDAAFVDSAQIASWAKPAMYWAYYQNIISGMGGHALVPQAFATRAQLAKILVGYLDKTT